MTRILFIVLAIFFSATSFVSQAQDASQKPFNGIITDIAGKPIKNAKIYIVNDKFFARSDKNGKFGLTNVQPDDTLHIKYQKEIYDIPVEGRKSIRIHLGDQLTYDEDQDMAATGYGWVKRRESLLPSNGISGEVLIRMGKPNIVDCLEGLVPGMNVTAGKITIRGINSINLSTDPLFILDGVEVNSLDFINVYDVDHVEVLKDGSMYGAKGANGVILVYTKRGK